MTKNVFLVLVHDAPNAVGRQTRRPDVSAGREAGKPMSET